ncbi:MAG: type IV pilus modification PilV family protein [Burkholderiales bacterium]
MLNPTHRKLFPTGFSLTELISMIAGVPAADYELAMKCRAQHGFSLIELIVFLVVAGIGAAALLAALANTMPRALTAQQITQGTQLAIERMELILGQKDNLGFAAVSDPCVGGVPPAQCTPIAGFVETVTGVAAVVACPAAIDPSTANCRTITVSVTGPTGVQIVLLTALVTNF